MTQSASARGSEFFNSHWQGLVNRVDDPFVRAILSRIGGDDWESVLMEEGIPLLDRIGVGVQYLDDREVSYGGGLVKRLAFLASEDILQSDTIIASIFSLKHIRAPFPQLKCRQE